MAANTTVLQALQDDFLTCQICHDIYRQPKALPCWGLHTFCQDCLRDYVVTRNFESEGRFPCPLCRRQIVIPPSGVAEFPNNVFIQGLVDKFTEAPPEESPSRDPVCPSPGRNGNLYPELPAKDSGEDDSGYGNGSHGNERPSSSGNRPGSGNHSNNRPSGHHSNGRPRSARSNGSARGQSTTTSPQGGSTRRRHNSRPRLIVRNMESLRLPITRGRHGAMLSFGKYGNGVIDFTEPVGLAVSQNGAYVVVSDRRDNRIMIFESTGQIKSLFTLLGEIHDIALNKFDQLLVANAENGPALASTYNLNGEKVTTYGNMFSHEKPHGVASYPSGNVAVSSGDTNCVYTLGATGKLLHTFGGRGRSNTRFQKPHHLATNSKNHVVISDCGNDCVKVLDKMGSFQAKMGDTGSIPGKLKQPRGVCVDRFNNVIVADKGNSRVQVFSPNGKFHEVLFETRHGSLIVEPINVALMPAGEIVALVTGHQYAEVRVYRYQGRLYKKDSKVCVCQ